MSGELSGALDHDRSVSEAIVWETGAVCRGSAGTETPPYKILRAASAIRERCVGGTVMTRKATNWILVAAALLFAGTLPVAWAQTTRLQQARTRKLKACVGLIPSLGEYNAAAINPQQVWQGDAPDPDAANPARSPDPNPYIFY